MSCACRHKCALTHHLLSCSAHWPAVVLFVLLAGGLWREQIHATSWPAAVGPRLLGLAVVSGSASLAGSGALIVHQRVGNMDYASYGPGGAAAGGEQLQWPLPAFVCSGLLSFWVLGGAARMVMPSDLRYLGAFRGPLGAKRLSGCLAAWLASWLIAC